MRTIVVVAAAYSDQDAHYLGDSRIYLVKDEIETLAKNGVYDTGIYTIDTYSEATSIILRRVAQGDSNFILLAHMRAY